MDHLRRGIWATAIGFYLGGQPNTAVACTTFALPGSSTGIVAKSYDWHAGHGLVVVNPRGLKKKAFLLPSSPTKPASWTAKYGSLTFNQFGVSAPLGGMNEQGLVVEIMWLAESRYPTPDERSGLNELDWIQYQLDNYATLAEVVENVDKLRVEGTFAKVHYLVCDQMQKCGTFEYIRGDLVTHYGTELTAPALTNHPYQQSVASLEPYACFGGEQTPPVGPSSLKRFARAAWRSSHCGGANEADVSSAFRALREVETVGFSKWNIVYETKAKKLQFLDLGRPDLGTTTINLSELDFSCQNGQLVMDMQGNITGQPRVFTPVSASANRKSIQMSNPAIGNSIPEPLIEQIVQRSEQVVCE